MTLDDLYNGYERTLSTSQFDYMAEKIALIVNGVLKLDPDLEPSVLADRFREVYNYGVVQGTPEQIAALQAHMKVNHGEMTSEDEDQIVDGIVNVAYLQL